MPGNFHNRRFDEGTVAKGRNFERYSRGWLPVFLSTQTPPRASIHIFDFFSGPGTDSVGQLGSPLRLLKQLRDYRQLPGWKNVAVHLHFFDESPAKTRALENQISSHRLGLSGVHFDVRAIAFEKAFPEAQNILSDQQAAKLVLIDQCGVDHVTTPVFQTLVASPTCDFLFFLSSSTLHRFHEHPAIKQRIIRPNDYFHVHRAALDYYRSLIEHGRRYFLAPFSIKKNSNIYGLIFGSAHPLGIDKFLQVAWDNVTGRPKASPSRRATVDFPAPPRPRMTTRCMLIFSGRTDSDGTKTISLIANCSDRSDSTAGNSDQK